MAAMRSEFAALLPARRREAKSRRRLSQRLAQSRAMREPKRSRNTCEGRGFSGDEKGFLEEQRFLGRARIDSHRALDHFHHRCTFRPKHDGADAPAGLALYGRIVADTPLIRPGRSNVSKQKRMYPRSQERRMRITATNRSLAHVSRFHGRGDPCTQRESQNPRGASFALMRGALPRCRACRDIPRPCSRHAHRPTRRISTRRQHLIHRKSRSSGRCRLRSAARSAAAIARRGQIASCPAGSGFVACFTPAQEAIRQRRFKLLHDDRDYCRDAYERGGEACVSVGRIRSLCRSARAGLLRDAGRSQRAVLDARLGVDWPHPFRASCSFWTAMAFDYRLARYPAAARLRISRSPDATSTGIVTHDGETRSIRD